MRSGVYWFVAGKAQRGSPTKGGKVKISKTASLVGILFCVVTISLTARTGNASVRIGGESLRANGQVAPGYQYTGPCPVMLQFGWGVIGTEPTTINYSFVRSDGSHSPSSETVELPQAGRSVPVYARWRLGANTPEFANFKGWMKILIDSPNQVEGKIAFTIHCQ